MHEKRFNRAIERLRDPERIERMEVSRVVELCLEGLTVPLQVVDVGVGSGLFAEEFVRVGCEVTGVDVNPEMLVAAAEFVPAGQFKEGLAEKLPLDDKSADLVFMGLVLHEADDIVMALSEARRVSRNRLAVLEWPDEDQPVGPPRSDRIQSSQMDTMVHAAGFTKLRTIRLNTLVLYQME